MFEEKSKVLIGPPIQETESALALDAGSAQQPRTGFFASTQARVAGLVCAAGLVAVPAFAHSSPSVHSEISAHEQDAARQKTQAQCASRVKFYSRLGALTHSSEHRTLISLTDCKKRGAELLGIFRTIESASAYFDQNAIGAVAVSACESTMRPKARSSSNDHGLFQQHNVPGTSEEFWPGRLSATETYMNARKSKKAKRVDLSGDIYNVRSNTFVSVFMLTRNGGESNWSPSRHCWSSSAEFVSGNQSRHRDFIAKGGKKLK